MMHDQSAGTSARRHLMRVELMPFNAHFWMGEVAKAERGLPAALELTRERGDRMGYLWMSLIWSWVVLAHDEPERALEIIARARRDWPSGSETLQDFWTRNNLCDVALYRDDGHGLDDAGACDLDARLKYRARRDAGGLTLADAGATDFAVTNSGPVEITSTAVTTATVGVPYSYDVEAENPLRESCITFALMPASESDPLPAGISVDAVTGLISWTPAPGQEGAHPIRVEASSQSLDGQDFTITVAPAP